MHLELRNTEITDAGLAHLEEITAMEVLDLGRSEKIPGRNAADLGRNVGRMEGRRDGAAITECNSVIRRAATPET